MDATNSVETAPRKRASWPPYVVGAAAGALVTVAVVALFGGFDSDDGQSTGASTTTANVATTSRVTTTSGPTTSVAPSTIGKAPSIVSFGVASSNCPAGAASTTVRITYQTTDATMVSFTVDNGPPSPAPATSGSRDVGPIPCDAQPHVVTLIAEANGLRATRQATVSVS